MKKKPVKRTWGLRSRLILVGGVLSCGLTVHWLFFAFVSITMNEGPPELEPTFHVNWIEEGDNSQEEDLQEAALLFDTEPLFLPTNFNSASNLNGIARLRDATELFPPFDPRVGELQAARPGIGTVAIAPRPLLPPASQPFRLFLDQDQPPPENAQLRGIGLQITSLDASAETIQISASLEVDLERIPLTLWSPLQYLMVIHPALGTELPIKMTSSGSEEWDRVLTQALVISPLLEELPNGYYQVLLAE